MKNTTPITPERRALVLFLTVSLVFAVTAFGAQKKDKKEYSSATRKTMGGRSLPEPSTTSLTSVGGAWTSQGPGPIQNGQVEGITNGPVAGAINAVVAHPTNADVIWVGTANGGIWKTTNGTNSSPSWTAYTDTAPSLSIADLQRDPTDGTYNTLVAATRPNSSFSGLGGPSGVILRSTNGGTAWNVTTPTALVNKNVTGIAGRGSTIVVSSADGGTQIYRSTDTGASFSAVTVIQYGDAWDLAGDPTSNTTLYTAIADSFTGGTGSGVYKSTDTGATWTRVSNSTMNTLLSSANNAEIAVGNSGQIFVGIVGSGQLSGIFRSGNGGSTWTQLDTPTTTDSGVTNGIHPGWQGGLHFSVAADPSNANIVYVGGDRQPNPFPNAIGAYDYTGRLFRVNAGASSGSQATPLTHCQSATAACNSTVSTNNNSAPHADSRAMTFDANGNLLEVDDGGIFRRTSPSGTGDWYSVNGSLRVTEFHNIAYDRISNMIIAGAQDNGTPEQSSVGGTTWRSVYGGDGGDVGADDTTSSAHSMRYGSYFDLQSFFRRQMDPSGNVMAWRFPSLTVINGGAAFDAQFTTPVELNRVDARRMILAGLNDLYESLDRGDTITALGVNRIIAAAVYGGRSGATDNVDLIWAISNATANYAATEHRVLRRASGSGAPTVTSSQPTTSEYLLDIASDPTDPLKAYVITSAGKVYSTSNGGSSWTDVTGNLGSGTTDIWTIVHIPGNPSVIAVGGLNGVFRMATNAAGTWNQYGTGLTNAIVYDLDYDPLADTLAAATLGRGAWTLDADGVSGTLPTINVGDATVTEGNSGTTNASFTVSLSAAATHTVGVSYATANSTATGVSTTASNSNWISIDDNAVADPYPSTISVSGVANPIGKVTVTLNRFRHEFPDDVDILLVGPGGQSVVLMSDAGGILEREDLDLTFDDAAASQLPDDSALSSGTYQPSDFEGSETFASPAPSGSYGSTLSVFNGTSANGTWSLYVVDDAQVDVGDIYDGWSISFSSGDYAPSSGTVTFPPGVTSRTVNITVHGDTTAEVNETFLVNLSSGVNGTIGDSQGVGTVTNDDALSAPTSVDAQATTTTNVQVTWTASPVASTYRVYRKSAGGSYTQVGEVSGSPFNDTVSANTAHLYKVRAVAGIESADSNVDLATTVIYTQATITAASTTVQDVDFTELLTAVNAVRALAGSGSYPAISFTSPAPANGVLIYGAHMNDLRNGLNPARTALGIGALTFTDTTITAGVTPVKAIHINELRNGVK